MYKDLATTYLSEDWSVRLGSKVCSTNKFFGSVKLQNQEQQKLDQILSKIFIETEVAELIPTLKDELPYKLIVCKEVQENDDIYISKKMNSTQEE